MNPLTLTGGTLLSKNNKSSTADDVEMQPLTSSVGGSSEFQSVELTVGSPSSSSKTLAFPKGMADALQNPQNNLLVQGNNHKECKKCDKGHCDAAAPQVVRPIVRMKIPPKELVQQDVTEILKAFKFLTKMGVYAILEEIYQAWVDLKGTDEVTRLLNEHAPRHDREGHTVLHWAAKRTDDVRFAQFWAPYVPLATTVTADGTGMTALHWTCTEGHTPFRLIQFFLDQEPSLLEAQDATQCTPLLLAAQHGFVETVAFLIQKGANWKAVDTYRDTATHWAAYKGSPAVLGLLCYYDKKVLARPDAYGQTPLHLAALRGNAAACSYILEQLIHENQGNVGEVLQLFSMPDKNNRTPHGLAVHKNQPHTARVLLETQNALQAQIRPPPSNARQWFARCREAVAWLADFHRWKMWMGISTGRDDPMDSVWGFPLYYTYFNILCNTYFIVFVYLPIFNPGAGVLYDCMLLHFLNYVLLGGVLYSLYQVRVTNPGTLDENSIELKHWRRLYEETLESYGQMDQEGSKKRLPLCHSCHIAKPPRSKHDRFTRCCVLLFDHHCPFVGNTIGLYNYKYFYSLLALMTYWFLQHWYLLFLYWSRVNYHVSPLLYLFGIYLGLHIFMAGGLWVYHTQLTLVNLTTNEHINLKKYDYFWEDENSAVSNGGPVTRKFKNPYYRGSIGNFIDRFRPSHASYLEPDQWRALQQTLHRSSSIGSKKADAGIVMV